MQADLAVGLGAAEAARYVGMSRRAWGMLCANGGAPAASKPFGAKNHPRWSRDELRAWVACGYPARDEWEPVWRGCLGRFGLNSPAKISLVVDTEGGERRGA